MRRGVGVREWLAVLALGTCALAPPEPARAQAAPDGGVLPALAPPRAPAPRPGAARDRGPAQVASAGPTRASATGADGDWVELAPPCRAGHTTVYDAARNRIVVVGGFGDDPRRGTWALSLSGTPRWDLIPTTGPAPPDLYDGRGAYDSARDRILVFDNYANPPFAALYALSLSTMAWSALTVTGPAPTFRTDYSMVYDSVHDRLLLCGGTDYNVAYDDVWSVSLGGAPAWTPLAPAGAPPPGRFTHAAIYDPARDRMVVFGGYSLDPAVGAVSLNDTWELTLSEPPSWNPLEPAGAPPLGGARAAAAYDAPHDRMLLLGGEFSNGISFGYLRAANALAFSPAPTWQPITTAAPAGRPAFLQGPSATYDPVGNRLVVFGGINVADYYGGPIPDAWSLTLGVGPTWSRLVPGGPSAAGRIDRSTIYDSARLRLVMFGGAESGGDYCCNIADIPTWAYTPASGAWQTLDTTTTRPPRRMDHTAIYDPVRDRMVLYAGEGVSDVSTDLRFLNFSGPAGWTLNPPGGVRPPGRSGHSAIYDPARDRMIVFGGSGSAVFADLNDVWAFSLPDNRWEQLLPAGTPPTARHGHAAIYDPAGDRMIVFGGVLFGTSDYLVPWALNLSGSPVWTPLPAVPPPSYARKRTLAIHDPLRQRLIVIEGLLDGAFQDEVWALNLVGPPAWTRLDIGGFEPMFLEDATAVYDPAGDRILIPSGDSSQLYALAFPPGGPTPALISLVSAEARAGRVQIVWQLAAGAGASATIYRRTPASAWQEWGRVSADGLGRVTFEDRQVAPGARYGYRIAPEGAGAGQAAGESWVETPAAAFALLGAVPNPAARGLRVEFSLPNEAPGRIDVIDIAGRRVASRDLAGIAPGPHALDLDPGATLRPGLYLVRLTQGARSLTARALVVP